jgi:predicted dienelactone hydrolase
MASVAADETVPAFQAGYRLLAVGPSQMPLSVWYPTMEPEAALQVGPYRLSVARNASLAPGQHRLILLSHGHLGSNLGHWDLAAFLARHGLIVAAPRHFGDSFDQPPKPGGRQLVTRPAQISAALDSLLSDPQLAPSIDAERIGMAGFSAGGYTSLVIAGATPHVEHLMSHCREHPEDKEFGCDHLSDWQAGAGELANAVFVHDPRVRAVVAMAPVGVLFDKADLAGISIPLRIYRAADDHILVNAWNSDVVLRDLPQPVEAVTVPGDHYVFLAPCSEAFASDAPELCRDPPGVDRIAIHQQINGEILDFFDRTLGR